LRVLHRALEGLRCGVQPSVVAEARVGEMVENLWDGRDQQVDPLAVRIYQESLRLLRRAPHAETMLSGEGADQEAFGWQMSRLAALEPVLEEYVREMPGLLAAALPGAAEGLQRDILQALADLRADAGAVILPLLARVEFPHRDLAVEALTWSRHSDVAPRLRAWVMRRVPVERRALRRRRALPPRRASLPDDFPYRAILQALRGHAAPETEALLLLAAHDWDPTFRAAAVGSLGYWEPFRRAEVLLHLQEARRDPNAEVRQAARAALARLGERQALQWFRQGLASEDTQRVHETIQVIALESITFLWPDLDRLADADDLDVAHHARESLERLSEDLERR
jgi:hypothetical protein